jgi:hypothetical protein
VKNKEKKMALTPEQTAQIQGASNPSIQFALPQTVVPVTKTQRQVQSVQYDPEKVQNLIKALQTKRPEVSKWEVLANALSNYPQTRSFKGGYGEEIINPWASGIESFAKAFGSTYSALKANERQRLEQEREDAIKAAQLEAEASKQAITDEIAKDYIKYNDPNAKTIQAAQEQANTMLTLDNMMNDLEDIGTRFDSSFKNIDEMQKGSTRWGRMITDQGWGLRTSDEEKLARDQFRAWKGSIKNVLVNANRQAGSGNMSDADAERYEQEIGKAKTPAQARNILDSFVARISMTPVNKRENILNGNSINQNKNLTADEIWKQLGE